MQQAVRESKLNGKTLTVVLDWKMKFEPKAFREPTSEHYGKHGISWHGAFAYYYQYVVDRDTGEKYVERVVVKTDQIMNGESNQDGEAVLSMVEAFLCATKDQLDFIEDAVICSDNAGCYHKKEFVFGCAVLNLIRGRHIRIKRLIHSETQDGKCLIDAHFTRGTRHVIRYIKTTPSTENKRVTSPKELAEALDWNGGIQNSRVQLIALDRTKLSQFTKAIEDITAQALEYFSRLSDIHFVSERFRRPTSSLCASDPSSWNEIELKWHAWAYNGIGEGTKFVCRFHDDTFEAQEEESDAVGSESDEKPNEEDGSAQGEEDGSIHSKEDDADIKSEDDNSIQSEDDAVDLFLDDIEEWRQEAFSANFLYDLVIKSFNSTYQFDLPALYRFAFFAKSSLWKEVHRRDDA
jgi:hypothetical protein